MRRSTAVRISVIGLVLASLMTACSTGPWATGQDGTSMGSDASAGGGISPKNRKKVAVPARSGISNLELVELHGAGTDSPQHGLVTAIFWMTNDTPVHLKLNIRLVGPAGNTVGANTEPVVVYTVGTHDVVASNVISTGGREVKSFQVEVVEVTRLSEATKITDFEAPTLTGAVLHGSMTVTEALSSSPEVKGACVLPDGHVVRGSYYLPTSVTKQTGGPGKVDYEIPIDEVGELELSEAVCYASV